MADVMIIMEGLPTALAIKDEHLKKVRAIASGNVYFYDSEAAAIEDGHDAEVMMTWLGTPGIPKKYILQSKRLEWINSPSAGMNGLKGTEVLNLPVKFTNAKGIHGKTMALSTLGYIISFLRGGMLFARNQMKHIWTSKENLFLDEAEGKTACIVGAGSIGAEVGRMCRMVGMNVTGVKRTVTDIEGFDKVYSNADMAEAISEADFVIIVTPLTSETHHMFDEKMIGNMKKTAVLINIGRGPVVDEAALVRALENGVIAGAALDATEVEPLPADSPLWDMENVIISPHCSADSPRYMDRAIDQFCENLKNFEEGRPLFNIIEASDI